MSEMNYKNLTGNDENLSADDKKVCLLVGSLKRVDAPKNFDFRLKARIANADTTAFQPHFPSVLRYILPLSLVILISAAIVFNNLYFNDSPDIPQVAKIQPLKTAAVSQTPENAGTSTNIFNFDSVRPTENDSKKVSGADLQVAAAKSLGKPKSEIVSKARGKSAVSGGSHTSASTGSTIIAPPGLNPNKVVNIAPDFETGKSISVKEILAQLGIEADFSGAGWLVKSVRQNSLADSSGVKSGDAVEALDGVKLTDQPLKSKRIEAKKLTVARGTEKIQITLGGQIN